MYIAYTGECRYEIQEQKEVLIRYTGPIRPLVKYEQHSVNKMNIFNCYIYTQLLCTSDHISHTTYFD